MPVRDHLQTTKSKHPIPQNVMDVEFKIVGDMTFKQFFYLCVGALIVWIITSVMQDSYLKYFILFANIIFFLALAFIPVQQRSLDIWIINFLKAMMTPTQRVWRKTEFTPRYLSDDFNKALELEYVNLKPAKSNKKLNEYLQSLPDRNSTPDGISDKLDKIQDIMTSIEINDLNNVRQEIIQEAENSKQSDNLGLNIEKQKNEISHLGLTKKLEIDRDVDDSVLDKNIQKAYSSLQKSINKAKIEVDEIQEFEDHVNLIQKEPTTKTVFTKEKHIQGFVKDSNRMNVDNAMVLVKDEKGDVQLALQTDASGYFKAEVELSNGNYTLEVIKGGMNFTPIKINTDNYNFNKDMVIIQDKV